MRDPVGKLTNRLHLLRLTELLFDGAALGHVARHLCEADQDAAIVVDGIDDRVRPEPGAVLAYPPTLRLESSIPSGGRQCALRHPVVLILGAIEHGKMLTNDFLCRISFDALGAGVPVGDNALRIQHVNGVIRHAPDKKPEAAFALTKLRHSLRYLSGSFFDAPL